MSGFIILVHAYEKYELGELSYIVFLIAGILFLSIALLHHRLIKHFPYADGFFFVIEALLYTVVAFDYFHMGKKGLPWCYIATAIAYVIAAIIKRKKGKEKHRRAVEVAKVKKSDEIKEIE